MIAMEVDFGKVDFEDIRVPFAFEGQTSNPGILGMIN